MEWKMEWNRPMGPSGGTKDEMSGAPSCRTGSTKQDGSKLMCDTDRETSLLASTDSVETLAMVGGARYQTSRAGRSNRRWMPMASASTTPRVNKHGAETIGSACGKLAVVDLQPSITLPSFASAGRAQIMSICAFRWLA